MRIFAISDLHTDFRKHRLALERLSNIAYRDDALLVAGDIAGNLQTINATLALLQTKFRAVCYVPGNHELWVGRKQEATTSIDKFFQVLALCATLGIHTQPTRLNNVWVVPLFSWYSEALSDDGQDYAYQLRGWTDFYSCRWPQHVENIPAYFSELNTPHIKQYDAPVITFSHFLPRPELLPPRRYLYFKALPEVAGSPLIETQIRQVCASVHVFGHSHIPRDLEINGIRYVNNPLSHSHNGDVVDFPLKIVWQEKIAPGLQN